MWHCQSHLDLLVDPSNTAPTQAGDPRGHPLKVPRAQGIPMGCFSVTGICFVGLVGFVVQTQNHQTHKNNEKSLQKHQDRFKSSLLESRIIIFGSEIMDPRVILTGSLRDRGKLRARESERVVSSVYTYIYTYIYIYINIYVYI